MRRGRFWFLVVIILIVSGGGAASGTILSGYLGGDVAVDVSPPLQLEEPWLECLPPDQNVFVSLDNGHQAFRIIAEVQPGDCFLVHLPIINQATVDTKAQLSIFYPYGASLWVTGSGVINDVVAASYQAWKFTADIGAQGSQSSPYDGIRIQVCVSSDFTGSSVEISGSVEGTSGMDGPFVIFSGQLSSDVLYLHNSPTPPKGDRESQPSLPMNVYPPSAATLYNYDLDLDIDPGRIIIPTNNGTAGDLITFQNWQMPVTEDLNLEGNITAVLWSATQYFSRTGPGVLAVYLYDLSDAGYAEVGHGVLSLSPWQPESATWVERKITINNVSYTVPAGHTLDMTVVAGTGSSAMWLAYDTIRYPSRLLLNSFPQADFSAEFVSSENTTVTVAFTDLTTSDEGVTSWLWSFGDSGTSTAQNPQHTYDDAGAYTVSLTVKESDDDSDTEVKTALVSPGGVTLMDTGPTAGFSASPTFGPVPMTVRFTDTSTSDDGILLWSWDFGDGQISGMRNPIDVYVVPGTYTVSLTVTEADGDTDTETKTGYITAMGNMGPTAAFTASPTSGYSPLTVNFTDQSTSYDSIVAWLWDFGDSSNSTQQNPTHIYATDGAYTVSLTVTEDDSDTDTETKTNYINVLPAGVPFADFTAVPTSGFEPLTVSFTDQSSSSQGIVSWLWDFGDSSNSTQPNPTHVYNNNGTYTVSLTITEADSDHDTETKTNYITVNDVGPTANFTAAPTSGYVPLTVSFTDQSTSHDGIVSRLWNFGDSSNSTQPNPQHIYTSAGTYTVSLTVTEADSDSDTKTRTGYITVLPITTYAVAYQGVDDDGFLKTATIATSGQIADSVLDTLEFDGWDGRTPSIAHVSGNIYAVAYQRSGLGYLRTAEVVMDGQIRDTVIDTLIFDSTQGLTPNIVRVSSNVYAIAYQGESNDGYLKTVEITPNGQITDTVIDTLEFDSSDGTMPSIVLVYGNIYAIAYQRYGLGYLRTVQIAANGQITDTLIDTLVFDGTQGLTPEITPVSGNIYAIAYQGVDYDGFLKTVEIATSGQITDTVIDTLEFDTGDGTTPSIIRVSGNIYAITYQRYGLGYLRTVEIATNGQITNTVIDTLVFDGTQGLVPDIAHVSGNIYAIAYQGVDDDGFIKTLEIATNGQITDSVIDTLEFDTSHGLVPTVIRLVTSPNQPPVAVNDSANCAENGFVNISVLANDSDPDGYTLKVTNLTQPQWGTVALNPNGTVTYTPYEGYVGPDSFTYTANDGMLNSNVATVSITVTP